MSTDTEAAVGETVPSPPFASGSLDQSVPPTTNNTNNTTTNNSPTTNHANNPNGNGAVADPQSTRRVTIGGISSNNGDNNNAPDDGEPAPVAENSVKPAAGGDQEQQQQQQQNRASVHQNEVSFAGGSLATTNQQQALSQQQSEGQFQQLQLQGLNQANASQQQLPLQGIQQHSMMGDMTMPQRAPYMGVDPFFRRGSMASFGGMDDFFARRGSTASLGFDLGMDAFFGGGGGRRDSMDSGTAALDQAIMDLSRRRYSTAMGSLGGGAGDMMGPIGAGHGNMNMSMGGGPVGSMSQSTAGGGSQASLTSHDSITARQQQLQQQQRDLEQRQKELELERQKLIASMQERSYGGVHGSDSHSRTMSLGMGSVGSGSHSGYPMGPPAATRGIVPPQQQHWWICQVCNSKAFASHEEAMAHENICEASQRSGLRSSLADPMNAFAMQTDPMMGPVGSMGRAFSMGLGGMMDMSGRGMSMTLGTMENSTRGVVSMGMDSSRSGSMGFDSSRNMSLGMDSSMSSSTYLNERTMSMGPFAMLHQPMPLAMDADKDWLTPLHCFVRRHCVEVFTACDSDVATPSKGKRKPIQVGQVGIRCPHCHALDSDGNDKARERGSVYYPTTIASIYNATMNLLQRHLHHCPAVPNDIMHRYETLKADDARSGTSKRYWIESALSLGLVDTPNGIRHSALRPPPLPSLTRQQESTGQNAARRNSNEFFSTKSNAMSESVGGSGVKDNHLSPESGGSNLGGMDGGKRDSLQHSGREGEGFEDDSVMNSTDTMSKMERDLTESAPLVTSDDKPYATAFSYQLLSQMQPCVFTEADRLGKRKGLPPGFPGLACRHCFGGYGSGRFFPSSIKTLSDTSKTLNVLHNHMMRCRKCPAEVKEELEKLRSTHDEERAKMKFGSQKAFFARIWEELHGKDHPAAFKRATPSKRPPSQGDRQQQQQHMMMMQQQQMQQQQQQSFYHQQQQQYSPGYATQMHKGSLDVLAAASSPSKRQKL